MSLAIAYGMKKKGKGMCHGGQMMAEGGFVEEEKQTGYEPMADPCENCGHISSLDSRKLNQHGEEEVGPMGMGDDNESHMDRKIDHPVENQSDEEDMVGRIMSRRSMSYSEGGRVSNDTPPLADSKEAQFDDLVKDDELEEKYTGENSGDEIGDDQEDKDRDDIISRIMKSRRLKNNGGSGSNERVG